MLLLGCKPNGRNTEQHDVLFAIGTSLTELKPQIYEFWTEAKEKIHVDAWREVTNVSGYKISVVLKSESTENNLSTKKPKLFFINLGGYKQNEFEEFHYKIIVACTDKGQAIHQAKQTAFYKHTGFKNASSHIDDRYGIDVDDIYEIDEMLPAHIKEKYAIVVTPSTNEPEDELHLGYFKMSSL